MRHIRNLLPLEILGHLAVLALPQILAHANRGECVVRLLVTRITIVHLTMGPRQLRHPSTQLVLTHQLITVILPTESFLLVFTALLMHSPRSHWQVVLARAKVGSIILSQDPCENILIISILRRRWSSEYWSNWLRVLNALPSASHWTTSPVPDGGFLAEDLPPPPKMPTRPSTFPFSTRRRSATLPAHSTLLHHPLLKRRDVTLRFLLLQLQLHVLELVEENGHERVGGQNELRKALEDVESARASAGANANS
jgi:hypothetical protein